MSLAASLFAHTRIDRGVAPTLEQAMAFAAVNLNAIAIAAGQPTTPVPS